jgi:hypothetical protein
MLLFTCAGKGEKEFTEQEIKIYLVAKDGSAMQGKIMECYDKLIETSKTIKVESSPLEAAITELISTKDTDELKNYIKGSQLILFQVTVVGGIGDVYLNGELAITSACDIVRVREQLYTTAKQFTELKKVNFYINTQPLEKYLEIAGQGFK